MVVKHLDGTLWTQGIYLRQNNLILKRPWGSDGVKGRQVIEKSYYGEC